MEAIFRTIVHAGGLPIDVLTWLARPLGWLDLCRDLAGLSVVYVLRQRRRQVCLKRRIMSAFPPRFGWLDLCRDLADVRRQRRHGRWAVTALASHELLTGVLAVQKSKNVAPHV